MDSTRRKGCFSASPPTASTIDEMAKLCDRQIGGLVQDFAECLFCAAPLVEEQEAVAFFQQQAGRAGNDLLKKLAQDRLRLQAEMDR